MAEPLVTLVRRRGHYKGRLTHYTNLLTQTAEPSVGVLKSYLNAIDTAAERFEEVQGLIEVNYPESGNALPDGTFPFDVERTEFDNAYVTLKGNILDKMEALQSRPVVQQAARQGAKLPDIQIPKFDGTVKGYLSFSRTFRHLVGDKDIDPIAKLHYLQGSCQLGVATQLVSSASDYQTAMSRLEQHYSNNAQLKSSILDELYDLRVKKEDDAEALTVFIDSLETNLSYLQTIGEDYTQWGCFFVHHLCRRIDLKSRQELERSKQQDVELTLDLLIQFIKNRIQVLKRLSVMEFKPKATSTPKQVTPPAPSPQTKYKARTFSSTIRKYLCPLCQSEHSIFDCPEVKQSSQDQLKQKVKEGNLCFNCLRKGHNAKDCQGRTCKKCGKKHHTIFHISVAEEVSNESKVVQQSTSSASQGDTQIVASALNSSTIVLATAMVKVKDFRGESYTARAFLDGGSSVHFMATHLAQILNLKRERVDVTISGVNGIKTSNNQQVTTIIKSCHSDYEVKADFLLTKKIVGHLPQEHISLNGFELPPDVLLADPAFGTPGKVDLLLGADIFFAIVNGNKQSISPSLWLYPTELGLIIAGRTTKNHNATSCIAIDDLKAQLQKFWEMETLQFSNTHSLEERAAELHYSQNVTHRSDQHYEVALPFNDMVDKIGNTAAKAKKIFLSSERRLRQFPEKQQHYVDFMDEMIAQGHLVPTQLASDGKEYFMIHHMVTRLSSSTTKYRIVFNGSFKSDTGVSLNDSLLVGPTIQPEVFSHLIRFRELPIAVTSDIAKMYRMVFIRDQDRHMQKIWWRRNSTEDVQPYHLTTVTYGTASAPFQAIRTLHQLAQDQIDNFPDVAPHLQSHFYVDDYVSSFPDLSTAKTYKSRLTDLARLGGFELRKWASNGEGIDDDLTVNEPQQTVLGVTWNRQLDSIILKFSIKTREEVTRSAILSEVAQMFDPLGLAAPVVLKAKLIMQRVWAISQTDWNEPIPHHIVEEWIDFRNQLRQMSPIEVPRCVSNGLDPEFDLHGFADASEDGYGACIYMVNRNGSRLTCAKSRIAPLKPMTMPRLELCAALLLATLMDKVKTSLTIQPQQTFYWTDSEITLFRIKSNPARYNVFVATRIAEIQRLTSTSEWYKISTGDNPADVVSRGLSPNELKDCLLWWYGASFLQDKTIPWPNQDKYNVEEHQLDLKKQHLTVSAAIGKKNKKKPLSEFETIISRFSSVRNAIHCFVYLLRFYLNTRKPVKYRNTTLVSLQEYQDAELRIIRGIQQATYFQEIETLKAGKPLKTGNKILLFNPFIDSDGILRVGGRLRLSAFGYDRKHPILIPKGHFAALVMKHLHRTNMHAGPQALLSITRQRYWIIGGRSLSRKIVHDCIICFKQKPRLMKQIMADIHIHRTIPSRAFKVVGVDFIGPFHIKPLVRSKVIIKVYVALFTCFYTRATHLEPVSDLSAVTFMNALRRFIARRGIPESIFSDNATNFLKGRKDIEELRELFLDEHNDDEIRKFCNENRINWLTIPARSPHFGGLWESMVKQFKHYFKHKVVDRVFNIEEMLTLLAEAEMVLNSRPLTPVSDDPEDLEAITPGHFLIGQPLNSLPEPTWQSENVNRLKIWQQIQRIKGDIWHKFQRDYFHELQRRAKWQTSSDDIKLNTLVLLHDNTPSTHWKLGRVVKLHPGPDKSIRVVTVKTSTGEFTRSITKIAPLPIDNSSKEEQ